MATARRDLAAELLADLRRLDAQMAESKKKLAAVVRASGTSVTGLFGVGPVVAAIVIGDASAVTRFPSRDHFAAWNGTAPVEVSSGGRKIYRLSRRGNRRVNYAIHIAAVTQIRHKHSPGRAYYDKKIAEGKTPKEALRALKRRISDAIYARLLADARTAAAAAEDPGGQPGNDSGSSAAGFTPNTGSSDKPLPGLTTTLRPRPAAGAVLGIPRSLPPCCRRSPQVQAERPQRSAGERPGGAARRRAYPAAGTARGPRPLATPKRPKATSRATKRPTKPLDTKRIRSGRRGLDADHDAGRSDVRVLRAKGDGYGRDRWSTSWIWPAVQAAEWTSVADGPAPGSAAMSAPRTCWDRGRGGPAVVDSDLSEGVDAGLPTL